MLVGQTMSGKTQVIHTLAQAMTLVNQEAELSRLESS